MIEGLDTDVETRRSFEACSMAGFHEVDHAQEEPLQLAEPSFCISRHALPLTKLDTGACGKA